MKIMRNVFIILISCTILLCFTGCSSNNNIKEKQFRKVSVEECIEYMENKYNEKFIFIEEIPTLDEKDEFSEDFNKNTTTIYVKSEKCPEEKVKIFARYEPVGLSSSGKIEYSENKLFDDNYVTMKYKKECMNKIEKVVNDIYGDCKVLYLSEETCKTLDADVSFEQYIKSGNCGLSIAILLPSSYDMKRYSEDSMNLYKSLKENKISTMYAIACVDNELYNSIITAHDFMNLKFEDCIRHTDYSMTDSF
ncbi:MAG: hypothetical protein K6B70_07610 [Clostridia bacterium]|nr:hypothetical protein [Clostridia bacterium]